MENIFLVKIGLLLELTGFVMASCFIALLKINIIEKIADRIKGKIIWFSNNFKSTAIIEKFIRIFKNISSKLQTSDPTKSKKIKLEEKAITGITFDFDNVERKTQTTIIGITSGNKKRKTGTSTIGIVFCNKEWPLYKINEINVWQYPVLIVQYLLFVLIIIFLVIVFMIFALPVIIFCIFVIITSVIIHDVFFMGIIRISKKLSGKDVITNLMIMAGVLIALAGLIIQLCAVW